MNWIVVHVLDSSIRVIPCACSRMKDGKDWSMRMLTGSDQLSHFDAGWYVIGHALAANSVMEIKGSFFFERRLKVRQTGD